MFKKLFSFVLLIVCCISSNQLYVNATELSSTKLDKCMEIGEDFLHDYYYTIDMKQKLNLSRYEIDYNVEQYINLKHELMKNRLVRNNVDVVYCDIDVSFTTINLLMMK